MLRLKIREAHACFNLNHISRNLREEQLKGAHWVVIATAMITNFFKKATPADIEEQKKRDAVYWAKRKEEEAEKLARDEERRVAAQKAKRHVGRPKMKRQPDVVLISPVLGGRSRRAGSYPTPN